MQAGLVLDVGAGRIEREHGARGGRADARSTVGCARVGLVGSDVIRKRLRKRAENVLSPFPTTTTDSTRRAAHPREPHTRRASRRAPIVRPAMGSMRDHLATFPVPPSPPASSHANAPPHGWSLGRVGAPLANALRAAGATVAVSECTSGGILAASLLSLPGASAFFTGAAVAYSPLAREALVPGCHEALAQLERATGDDNYASTDRYYESRVAWAAHAARDLQLMCGADWGVAEVGAAGPTFHPSADADSGFTVVAVAGPPRNAADDGSAVDRVWVRLCETGHARREENMWQFAAAAAELCARCVGDDAFPADTEPGGFGDAHWKRALDGVTRTVR